MARIVEERGVVGVVHVPQEVAIGGPHLTSADEEGLPHKMPWFVRKPHRITGITRSGREHLQET
jgi:hypothetical protein